MFVIYNKLLLLISDLIFIDNFPEKIKQRNIPIYMFINIDI